MFKARKKVITRKRECSARVGRSRADDCVGVVYPQKKILYLLVESSKRGERSRGMIDLQTLAWWKQVEGKYTDDLRNEFCWEVRYL